MLLPALSSPLQPPLRHPTEPGGLTLSQVALSILRRPGLESHVFLPGVGWVGGFSLTNAIMEGGTQPASVDNPVGYMGDAASTTLGANLAVNSTFDDASWWSDTGSIIYGGKVNLITSGAYAGITKSSVLTVGKTYYVEADVVVNSGPGGVYFGSSVEGVIRTTTGRLAEYFTATSATLEIKRSASGVAVNATVDNISVRELVGAIPARQATTANKPILRRGAVNRALFSQQFDNATWSTTGVVASDQATAPDGTLTADRLTISGATQSLYNSTGIAVQPDVTYTQSVRFKLGTMTEGQYRHAFYNNTAASFITQDVVPTITDIGDGWKLAVSSVVVPAGCTSLRFYPYRNTAVVNGTVFLWGAQLETGSTASPYIPTTTAAAEL